MDPTASRGAEASCVPSATVCSGTGGGSKSGGLYDTLVRTGIEKRMTSNEKELHDLKEQLAKLEAMKNAKKSASDDPATQGDADKRSAGESNEHASEQRGILVEREPENMLDMLMDEIFAEMFAEMKGYRPTKAEIAAFKSTQMDDYDAELEEFECEAYDQEDGEDEYYPEYDEYAYEEAERQRLLQEMLESEESFDVTTHGAVFFDVTPEMQQLSITGDAKSSNTATKGCIGAYQPMHPIVSTGKTTRLIIEDAKSTEPQQGSTENNERTTNVTNFKLNAAAKEWKPPGLAD